MMKKENIERGKKARRSGSAFELKVRKKLESEGWIVFKNTNNVEFLDTFITAEGYHNLNDKSKNEWILKENIKQPGEEPVFKAKFGKLVPAKRKYNPFNKVLSVGTGFVDFIAFRKGGEYNLGNNLPSKLFYEVIGVESKKAKYLDAEEKLKCEWLIKNNIFSKILVAYAGKKRGEIKYYDFEKEYMGR